MPSDDPSGEKCFFNKANKDACARKVTGDKNAKHDKLTTAQVFEADLCSFTMPFSCPTKKKADDCTATDGCVWGVPPPSS